MSAILFLLSKHLMLYLASFAVVVGSAALSIHLTMRGIELMKRIFTNALKSCYICSKWKKTVKEHKKINGEKAWICYHCRLKIQNIKWN